MSDKPNNGGPAFPITSERLGPHSGMTLRDWFAGQALANPYTNSDGTPMQCALWAYEIADAMIAKRNKL